MQLGNGITESDLLVHNETHPRPAYAFMLAHMEQRPGFPTPIGVLRNWGRRTAIRRHDGASQINDVIAKKGKGDLTKLLRMGDTWEVTA